MKRGLVGTFWDSALRAVAYASPEKAERLALSYQRNLGVDYRRVLADAKALRTEDEARDAR